MLLPDGTSSLHSIKAMIWFGVQYYTKSFVSYGNYSDIIKSNNTRVYQLNGLRQKASVAQMWYGNRYIIIILLL